jgi:DnaJ-class molecular chaperone
MVLQLNKPATATHYRGRRRLRSVGVSMVILLSLTILPGCNLFSGLCPNRCWYEFNEGKCPSCKGRGTVSYAAKQGWVVCSQCQGDCRMACPFCRGAGWIADDSERCIPATQEEVDSGRAFRCSVCHASGSVTCTGCQSGSVWGVTQWGSATCPECHGSGICQTCGGDGSVFTLRELWSLMKGLFWLAVGLVFLVFLFYRPSQGRSGRA